MEEILETPETPDSNEKDAKYIQMTQTPVPSLIIKLAIPTIISMLVTGLYNMADTFFVGQISTVDTAAVSLVLTVMSIIQAGGTPSNDLLARAGLSRADANAMTKQVEASGGGGYYSPGKKKDSGDTSGSESGKPSDDTIIAALGANGNGNKTTGLIKDVLDAVSSGAKTAQINNIQNDINQLSKQFATALTDTERANINNQIMNKQNEINKIKNGQTGTNSLKNDSIKRG